MTTGAGALASGASSSRTGSLASATMTDGALSGGTIGSGVQIGASASAAGATDLYTEDRIDASSRERVASARHSD
jgi:hypothetical protein